MKQKYVAKLAIGACIALAHWASMAQTFPNKPVTLYVPWAAGGGGDTVARAVSKELSKKWGQPIVVENKPGAAGVLATQALLRAPADGYTILFTAEPIPAINPHVISELPYKTEQLSPVTAIVTLPQVLIVSTANPNIQTLPALLDYALANPGKLSYGSFGPGSTPQIVMETFKSLTGTDIIAVPYKGANPAMTDVASGTIDMTLTGPSGAKAMVDAGRAKIIAVAVNERLKNLPEVMTFREANIVGADYTSFLGLMVQAGTPDSVIKKIANDVHEVLQNQEFVDTALVRHSYTPVGSTPEEFAQMIERMSSEASVIIKKAGIQAE